VQARSAYNRGGNRGHVEYAAVRVPPAYNVNGDSRMAFILHLIDSPEVTTVKAAEIFLVGAKDESSVPNPKFAAFVESITAAYPDLSEADEDGDDDENVWEEGLPADRMTGRRFAIALKEELTDPDLVKAMAKAAAGAGVQLFDAEGMVLYRADRMVVDMSGRERRL
jgi:hypothetical protein